MTQLITVVGIVLTAAGMASFGYALYLEMLRAVPLRGWDRIALLAPAGLAGTVGGLALVLRSST